MEKYNIKTNKAAVRDLEDIVDYINTLSPQAAIAQFERIIEGINSLETLPERCPIPNNMSLRAKGYRMLIIDNYLVFFVIIAKTVRVRRVFYNKRNYEWLL